MNFSIIQVCGFPFSSTRICWLLQGSRYRFAGVLGLESVVLSRVVLSVFAAGVFGICIFPTLDLKKSVASPGGLPIAHRLRRSVDALRASAFSKLCLRSVLKKGSIRPQSKRIGTVLMVRSTYFAPSHFSAWLWP